MARGQSTTAKYAFIVALLVILPLTIAITDKTLYNVGEPVLINTTNDSSRIMIFAPEAKYRLLDEPGEVVPFVPKTPGEYTVQLIDSSGQVVHQDIFTVQEANETNKTRTITISEEPRAEQNVHISITPPPTQDIKIIINGPGGLFKYFGPWRDSPFVPKYPGLHEIIISENGAVVGRHAFTVQPALLPQPTPDEPEPGDEIEEPEPALIVDVPAQEFENEHGLFTFGVVNNEGQGRYAAVKFEKNSNNSYEVHVTPDSRAVQKLDIHDCVPQETIEIGIDDLPKESVEINGDPVLKAYAINLDNLNFSNATATSTAQGSQLWKCAKWNFTTQTCFGTWELHKYLRPGEQYDILLYPGDPGYAETGVATVNTRKPIYRPNETAEIVMVVLDNNGFLVSNADIQLLVTDPNNITTNITTIIETSDGVYEAIYTPEQEGTYDLFVEAHDVNVNQSMLSFFLVQEHYPFDIIRNAPVTIDPFKELLAVSVTVTSFNHSGAFNYTEVLPINFTNITSTATQTQDTTNIFLTWNNLSNGSTVSYTATIPKITPELYQLGQSKVAYDTTTITEARPWYLAIDPEFSDEPVVESDVTALDEDLYVVAYIEETSQDASFRIIHTNETDLYGAIDIDTDVQDGSSNWGRIDAATINTTHFLINLYDADDDTNYIYVYNKSGHHTYRPIGEAGSTQVEDFNFQYITFANTYSNAPVVIATPASQNAAAADDNNGFVPVVKDVTSTGFNVSLCRDNAATTCDTDTDLETVHYVVVDPDAITAYDWIAAGTTAGINHNGADNAVSFGKTLSGTPFVFATPQTYTQTAGEMAMNTWIEGADTNASHTTVLGCVHEDTGDTCTGGDSTETVGWIAIDTGNHKIGGFQSGSADISNSDWTAATFTPTFADPIVMVTQNDDDGGQDPQYPWARNVVAGGMDFRYCEQDGNDDCDTHTGELVYWGAFEQGTIGAPFILDTDAGVNVDVSSAYIQNRIVSAWVDDTSGDDLHGMIHYLNGSVEATEFDIDDNVAPDQNLQNLVSVVPVSDTRWFVSWFDDATDDLTAALYDETGSIVAGPSGADLDVGGTSQMALAGLRDEDIAMFYYDSPESTVKMLVVDTSADSISAAVGPVNIDTSVTSQVRLDVAEIEADNESMFVLTWYDQGEDVIEAVVYNRTGTLITPAFNISTNINDTYRLHGVAGYNSQHEAGLCNGTFVVSFTNSSAVGERKLFLVNGSTWDGFCGFDDIAPNITLNSPANDSTVPTSLTDFNWTADDDQAVFLSCNLTINGNVEATIGSSAGVAANKSLILSDGLYIWNVTCQDTFGNVNTSETRFVTVDVPTGYVDASQGQDVALAALDNTTIIVTWVDVDSNHTSFEVWDANGTLLVPEVDIDTTVDDSSRIAAAPINETHFVVIVNDGPEEDVDFYIYHENGSAVVGQTQVDADVNIFTDMGVCQYGAEFIVAYGEDLNNDYDGEIYTNDGTLSVSEFNIDGNIAPAQTLQNLVDCTTTNSTRAVTAWFDDSQNDLSARIIPNTGASIINNITDIDTNIGETGQVAIAHIGGERVGIVYFDSAVNHVNLTVLDVGGDTFTTIGSAAVDTDLGTETRVAAAEVEFQGTSNIAVVWQDRADNSIKASVFDNNGSYVAGPFNITSEPDATYLLHDAIGADTQLGFGICEGSFVVAFTNSSGDLVWKGFYQDGGEWGGTCIVDEEEPTIVLNAPLVSESFAVSLITFNWTATDNTDPELACDLIVDGAIRLGNIPSPNGTATTRSVEVANGAHTWNVTCTDNRANKNTSEQRAFTVNAPSEFNDLELPKFGEVGILLYANLTDPENPLQRNWTGVLGEEENIFGALGSNISWYRFVCAQRRPECYAMIQEVDNSIDFAVFDIVNRVWHNITQVEPNRGLDVQRSFDVACEDLVSEDCLVVYETANGLDGDFAYRLWNGDNLSTEQTYSISGAPNNDFRWLELCAQKDTNLIGMGIQNDAGTGDIYATVWDGDNNVFNHTINVTLEADGDDRKQFSCAWEGNSGEMLFAYGNNSDDLYAWRFQPSTNAWTHLGNIYDGLGAEAREVHLCGESPSTGSFAHDYIGVMTCDQDADRDGGYWDGSAFSKALSSETPVQDTASECGGNEGTAALHSTSCAIEKSGDQIVYVWVDANEDFPEGGFYTISSNSWSFSDWGEGNPIGQPGGGDVGHVITSSSPGNDEIFVYDQGEDDTLSCALWTGRAFTDVGCGDFENDGTATSPGAYIEFEWQRMTHEPLIEFIEPADVVSTYTYTGITHPSNIHALYDGANGSLLPTSTPVRETEISTSSYSSVTTSNNVRLATTTTTDTGESVYQSFRFEVTESPIDIEEILFFYEGYVTQQTFQTADTFYIYVFNHTSNSYTRIHEANNTIAADMYIELELQGVDDILDDGDLHILIVGNQTTAAGIDARADIFTDYVEVRTRMRPNIRLTQLSNISAEDDNGVDVCDYYYHNDTIGIGPEGTLKANATSFYNSSDTTVAANALYNLTAECNDTFGAENNETIDVRIDNVAPSIALDTPGNNTSPPTSNVTFGWNGTDDFTGTLICNLTIDDILNVSNVAADVGGQANVTVFSVPDGTHNWSVTCIDQAGNSATSETFYFTQNTGPPTVTLNAPAANAFLNESTVLFNYTPVDPIGIGNCTLILDGVANETNTSVTANQPNFFNITGISNGVHLWSVNCTDLGGFEGSSSTRNFTVDTIGPLALLNTTDGITFTEGVASLNFTVFDNLDTELLCNITINGVVEDSNIPSPARAYDKSCDETIGEAGAVQVEDFQFAYITYNRTYTSTPVVIATPASQNAGAAEDDNGFVAVVKDVTTTGFNVSLCSDNGATTCDTTTELEDVHYVVIDVDAIAGYDWIAAGTSTGIQGNGVEQTMSFGKTLSGVPHVWGTMQTYTQNAGEMAMGFWFDDADTTTSQTGLTGCVHEGIANDCTGSDATETIGWVAITPDEQIVGYQNSSAAIASSTWTAATFTPAYTTPIVMVAQNDDAGGQDTQYRWARSVVAGGMDFRYCEQDAADTCDTHAAELMVWGAFEEGNVSGPPPDGCAEVMINRNLTLPDGLHFWNVTCVDEAGNYNISETRNFTIVGPPFIELQVPVNGTTQSGNTVNFTYYVQDGDGIGNCSLIIDDVVNRSNTTGLTVPGNNSFIVNNMATGVHTWTVNCTDNLGENGTAYNGPYTINIDGIPPFINLSLPLNDTTALIPAINFNFTPIDDFSANMTCNLTIDGVVDSGNLNFNAPNNTLTNRVQTLGNGIHEWNVTCSDASGNVNTSETRFVTVNITLPVNISVVTDKSNYQQGEIVNITVTVFNSSWAQLNTNVTTDIIYTNASTTGAPWWNTSWGRRIAIDLNETTNSPRYGEVVLVNISNLDGYNTDCDTELRIVEFKNNVTVELPRTIVDGNGTHYCEVFFAANITANAFDQDRYFAYFNNTGASGSPANATVASRGNVQRGTVDGTGADFIVELPTPVTVANSFLLFTANSADTSPDGNRFTGNITNSTHLHFSRYLGTAAANISWQVIEHEDITMQQGNNTLTSGTLTTTADIAEVDVTKSFIVVSASGDSTSTSLNNIAFVRGHFVNSTQIEFERLTGGAESNVAWQVVTWEGTRVQNGTATMDAGDTIETVVINAFNDTRSFIIMSRTIANDTGLDENHVRAEFVGSDRVSFERSVGANGVAMIDWFMVEMPRRTVTQVDDSAFSTDTSVAINEVVLNRTFHISTWESTGGGTTYTNAMLIATLTNGTNLSYDKQTASNTNTVTTFVVELSNYSSIEAILTGHQIHLQQDINESGVGGNFTNLWNSSGRDFGNYSAVGRAVADPDSLGVDHAIFGIASDIFPPEVTILAPPNNTIDDVTDITFVYTANDLGTTIANCSLLLNGEINQTNTTITEMVNQSFLIENMGEGDYSWTVQCTDTVGNIGNATNGPFRLIIDETDPVVTAIDPDGTVHSSNDILFNFTVADNVDLLLFCNISVDEGTYWNTTTAVNGSVTTGAVSGIGDGFHYWNVTCYDDNNNTGISNTLNFTNDAAPLVVLTTPVDGYGTPVGNISFNYTVVESSLSNCSLIIDGIVNQTKNSSEIPNQDGDDPNEFNLTGIPEGVHNWTVTCVDTNGFSGSGSPVREFHVDSGTPTVTLNAPANNATFFVTTVDFNFTAIDNIDPVLDCNVTVNGDVNITTTADNGTATVVTGSGFTAGNYSWNVTCIDNTGFVNTSETLNFSVSPDVNVILNSPDDNASDSDGDVTFIYTPQSVADFDSGGFCELIIDGSNNQTDGTITNNAENNFTLESLNEGSYTWQVNCTDNDVVRGASEIRTIYIDFTNPTVQPHHPNGTTFAVSTILFNWTAIDNIDPTLSCNVSLDSVLVAGDIDSPNGSVANTTISSINDSLHLWEVSCTDDSGRIGASDTFNFTVNEPPKVVLDAPSNGTRAAVTSFMLNYTPTDNSENIGNCTLIVNGLNNQTNTTVSHNVTNDFNLTALAHGEYNWTVSCIDLSSNEGINDTNYTFYVDLFGPTIILNLPLDLETLNSNNVTFNWTPIDHPGSTVNCSLFVTNASNNITVTGITGTANTDFNTTVAGLADGSHDWNVTCSDDLGNTNNSLTQSFVINQPDLVLNETSRINFNETNPDLGETINITANVSNIGGTGANDVLVQFWDGLPSAGGTLIGNDTQTVAFNSSTIFSVSWNITFGYHEIFVSADPDGLIGELVENNNNASRNISLLFANITQPLENNITADTTPQIDFNISDFTGGNLSYVIYVDDTANGQVGVVQDLQNNSLNITALADGVHTIIVQANDTLQRFKNSTPLTIRIDTTAPNVTFLTQNDSWYAVTNVTIEFNITDVFSANLNYTFYLDGTLNHTNTTTNNTRNTVNLSNLAEGQHTVTVEAEDELGNIDNSTVLTFYVDLTPPVPNTTTANNTWFNTLTPGIDFNITDNLDPILNYTIYVDGVANTNGTSTNGVEATATLNAITEGNHTIIVQALDEAGHVVNDTEIVIYVDVTPPNVTLLTPLNDTNLSSTSVTLNFTVSDNLGTPLICNLTLDDVVVSVNVSVTNGSFHNFTVNDLNSGYHFWNATCIDNATNAGISETWQFFVELSDLEINAGNITFSNSTPIENQTVEVNATVFNIGNLNATNITVQFFLGDPDLGGVQINGNATIASLGIGENTTVSMNHSAVIGLNRIYVLVDPPLATNGSIAEENESNNEAFRDFNVGHFEIFAGTSGNELKISDASIISAFKWNQTNVTGSNVFVADTDSSLIFTSLQAIGRNTTNGTDTGNDDFEEIDQQLNATSLNDSVNLTWTSGGAPVASITLQSFKRTITDIPVVNSTNTSSFVTGILWDTSDGGSAYNTSQDIVFVTIMNESQAGQYGIYDYEIKIPATLRDYILGGGSVSFYTELR
ncbi:MAG: Ig-like domain-containing protein [Candidatus Woesearchaeota archaeon]|nr:Ig-like domain-containing protein [Candidatus Woesearchaeota archaeon]